MNKIEFKNIVLFVNDIKRSRKFYENIFEQKIVHDFGTNVAYEGGLSLWQLSDKHLLHDQLLSRQKECESNRIEVYFEVVNIKEFYCKLEEENVRFIHRLHIENWQQITVRFLDLDNHLIEVGESMNSMVTRLKNEGHNVKEISKLTFLEEEYIAYLLKE